jgi:rhodanese-related sulfurtransferase
MTTHILLLASAFTTLLLCSCGQADQSGPQTVAEKSGTKAGNITISDADKLLKENKAVVVLDVRTADEFKAGHIPGAMSIDFYQPDFRTKLGGLDRNQTYLVHCKSGGRSAKTEALMKELKFNSVLHLNEGFSKWEAAGKPVEH